MPDALVPQHEWLWCDDFIGSFLNGWQNDETLTADTPYNIVDIGEATVSGAIGSLNLYLDATAEAQVNCWSFGNVLAFDIDKIRGFECRVKLGQATLDSATQVAFGLTGDRNDTIDTIAKQCLFRVIGADDTTAVVAESDDGTTDRDDIATGATLANAWKRFTLIFPPGQASVEYYIDDQRVASGTTFDMSAHHGGMQPFFQIQKSSDTNADTMQIDYVKVWGVR